MKKQIIASIITISLTNLVTHAMEQALVCNGQFDKLPKHELNMIASSTKRAGKDTLRCVNKALNAKIISQDELYAQYNVAELNKDQNAMNLLSSYNTFDPNIHLELIDAINDNNERLVPWCLDRTFWVFIQTKGVEAAARKGNVNIVKIVLNHCKGNNKYSFINDIVRIAAQNGHLPVIKAFINSYATATHVTAIDFSLAIHLAKKNKHQEVADYLANAIPRHHRQYSKKNLEY